MPPTRNREVKLKDGTLLTGSAAASYGEAPISTASLTPEKPIEIPESPTPIEGVGLQGQLETLATGTTNDLSRKRDEAQKKSETSFEQYIKSLASSEGKTELEAQAFSQEGGVDDLQTGLDDINQQMLAEQEGLRRQVEAIETGAGTATLAQRQSAINEARRVSLRKQADLAIIQLSRQGRFDSARAIADRAVAAEMEQDYRRTEIFGKIYEENRELFTTAEAREFETMQQQRLQEAQNKEFRLRAEFEQQLQQNDPLYKLDVALKNAQLDRVRKETALLGRPSAADTKATVAALKEAQSAVPVMQDKIAAVDVLKNHPGMKAVVGPNVFARSHPDFNAFTGVRQEFIGGVEKMLSGLTLDSLIEAKKRGATFGALSDSELNILAAAASAIKTWQLKDGDDKVYGYDVTEAAFKAELDTIKTLTQRALVESGQSLITEDESALLDGVLGKPVNPASYF